MPCGRPRIGLIVRQSTRTSRCQVGRTSFGIAIGISLDNSGQGAVGGQVRSTYDNILSDFSSILRLNLGDRLASTHGAVCPTICLKNPWWGRRRGHRRGRSSPCHSPPPFDQIRKRRSIKLLPITRIIPCMAAFAQASLYLLERLFEKGLASWRSPVATRELFVVFPCNKRQASRLPPRKLAFRQTPNYCPPGNVLPRRFHRDRRGSVRQRFPAGRG